MQIQELYIKNFGKFYHQHFFIQDGIQVFYGENEFGKSTLYAFIKAMLFGMERGRGRAAGRDDYSRYEPWENPNYYGGAMRFVCGGKHFLLERNFDRYQKNARLICEDDGEELSVEDGDLTMLLDGMTLSVFENTAAIGQMAAKPGEALAAALKNYAANYSATLDQDCNLQKALERLKDEKKRTLAAQKKEAEKRREEQERLHSCQEYLYQDMERLSSEMQKLSSDQEKIKDKMQKGEGKESRKSADPEDARRSPESTAGVMMWILALCLAGGSGLSFFSASYVAGVFLAFLGAAFLGIGLLLRKTAVPDSVKETEEREEKEQLNWKMQHLQEEYREKLVQYQNLQETAEELDELTEMEKRLILRRKALELADTAMRELAEKLSADFEKKFNEAASEIISAVTQGAYSRLILEPDGALYLYENTDTEKGIQDETNAFHARRIPVERVSCGTAQQVWFAFRMAAAQVLAPPDFPLILDETFAFYDEHRLKSTLKWLRDQSRQVIIFTCQKREREALKEL